MFLWSLWDTCQMRTRICIWFMHTNHPSTYSSWKQRKRGYRWLEEEKPRNDDDDDGPVSLLGWMIDVNAFVGGRSTIAPLYAGFFFFVCASNNALGCCSPHAAHSSLPLYWPRTPRTPFFLPIFSRITKEVDVLKNWRSDRERGMRLI